MFGPYFAGPAGVRPDTLGTVGTVLCHDNATSTAAMQAGAYAANTSPSGATSMADIDYLALNLNHTPARGK